MKQAQQQNTSQLSPDLNYEDLDEAVFTINAQFDQPSYAIYTCTSRQKTSSSRVQERL